MSAVIIRRHDWIPAIRPLADGEAVAAIGDVHGQDDLFATLRSALVEEMSGAARATFVQLGDLIDRGPGAISAMRRARTGVAGAASVTLMGNHEDRMLTVLGADDPEELDLWMRFGGDDTLAEAGITIEDPDWRAAFRRALGPELHDWARSLPTLHRVGDIVFVHAGLDPAAPLAQQTPHTLMWTRRRWLESAGPYAENVAVIHGHTPQPAVDLSHPHRINLDTGAFKTGLLSGLVIAGDRMRLVQAAR